MVWGINYCCPMWKEMITFFCFSLAVFGAFQAIDAQRSRKTFRSARRNCFAVRELVLSSATVRGKRFPQRRFNSQLEIEFATWAVQREIIKLGIALEKFIDNQPIKLRAIIYVFPAHVLCQRDEGLHICIIAQLKPRQLYDEEIDRLGTIWCGYIPLFEILLVTLFQKLRRQPNTRISLTRSFIFPKTLVSVRLTHGIIGDGRRLISVHERLCFVIKLAPRPLLTFSWFYCWSNFFSSRNSIYEEASFTWHSQQSIGVSRSRWIGMPLLTHVSILRA